MPDAVSREATPLILPPAPLLLPPPAAPGPGRRAAAGELAHQL